jgi:hypothetical protein
MKILMPSAGDSEDLHTFLGPPRTPDGDAQGPSSANLRELVNDLASKLS